jgi:hypothetical protein
MKRTVLRLVRWAIGIGAFGLGAMALPWAEQHFLNTPGAVEVVVVQVTWAHGPAGVRVGPLHYLVKLPDGAEGHFSSETMYIPGQRLRVTASRGRVTGRLYILSDPSSVVEDSPDFIGRDPFGRPSI